MYMKRRQDSDCACLNGEERELAEDPPRHDTPRDGHVGVFVLHPRRQAFPFLLQLLAGVRNIPAAVVS